MSMISIVGTGKNRRKVAFNTEQIYMGEPSDSELEKNARRILKLPVTKQLVYYPSRWKDETIKVTAYWIDRIHPSYITMQLLLENRELVLIHIDYFREMQSNTFIEDMKKIDRVAE